MQTIAVGFWIIVTLTALYLGIKNVRKPTTKARIVGWSLTALGSCFALGLANALLQGTL